MERPIIMLNTDNMPVFCRNQCANTKCAKHMEHQQCADPEGSKTETYKTAMKSVIKSSPFERAMKVEAELNKLHGRIIKQLDSIKAYELEDRRLQLAEKQLELNKQKLTGEFEIDPDGSTENDEITDVVDDV